MVLSGDGSFRLNGFDFETCIRFGMKVTVVVGNDAAWGPDPRPAGDAVRHRALASDQVSPVRYDRVVEAFGGVGFHVESPDELLPTLRQALDHPQVACVNVARPRVRRGLGRCQADRVARLTCHLAPYLTGAAVAATQSFSATIC